MNAKFFQEINMLKIFQHKCFICGSRDEKENMEYASYGIYGNSKHYYHLQCVETVICDPENYTHRTVDRALWCHDSFLVRKMEDTLKAQNLKKQIDSAQENLECLRGD